MISIFHHFCKNVSVQTLESANSGIDLSILIIRYNFSLNPVKIFKISLIFFLGKKKIATI
jgi:hypothetical protein